MNESGKNEVEKTENGATETPAQKSAQRGMFKATDYVPFMLGILLIGGLIGVPLTYGAGTGLGYFEALPWALASCVVFLIGFRRNGTISWARAIPAIVAIVIGASIYSLSTGKRAFAVGGGLGFLLLMVCGYIGIGIGIGRGFNSFMAVFKRELKSYFTTPLAYVFLVIFLFFAGYLTFKEGFYEMRQADMRTFFMNLPLLFVFMVPSAAMRLWAEERKVGSIELLFTLPITIRQAVLGKFFAAWLFLAIALALTFPMVITVCYLGDPDIGLIITGYIGSLLMAGGFLAIGCFFSAVSKNQVISFVLSVVACAVFVFAGMPTTLNYLSSFMPAGLVAAVEGMSFQIHFDSMQRGVLEFKDLAYFVLIIVGWIAACTIILDERKAG